MRHVQQRTWSDARQTERGRIGNCDFGLKSLQAWLGYGDHVVKPSPLVGWLLLVLLQSALAWNGWPERENREPHNWCPLASGTTGPRSRSPYRVNSTATPPPRHDTTRHASDGTGYCRNYSDVLCPRGPQGAWPNDCHAGPTRVVPSVGSQLRRRRAGPEILPVRAQYRILRHETNVQST